MVSRWKCPIPEGGWRQQGHVVKKFLHCYNIPMNRLKVGCLHCAVGKQLFIPRIHRWRKWALRWWWWWCLAGDEHPIWSPSTHPWIINLIWPTEQLKRYEGECFGKVWYGWLANWIQKDVLDEPSQVNINGQSNHEGTNNRTWRDVSLKEMKPEFDEEQRSFYKQVHPSLWPSGIGSPLGQNRLWVQFLAVSDIYPIFIEATLLGSLQGSLGT